jgi:CRISPR-associated protein Cas2
VHLLITYDVSTTTREGERRLRKVARACEDFGQRVQKSVFECRVGPAEWAKFKFRLLKEMNVKEDSIRVYFLDASTRVEHYGADAPTDLAGPLVI